MEKNNSEAKKVKKSPQKAIMITVWAVAVLLLIATVLYFIADYSGYKKGQEFGLSAVGLVSKLGINIVDGDMPYEEQCKTVYDKLSALSDGVSIAGINIGGGLFDKGEEIINNNISDLMKKAGFEKYSGYGIKDWFKYTSPTEYFFGEFWRGILPVCLYIYLAIAVVLTVIVSLKAKKKKAECANV